MIRIVIAEDSPTAKELMVSYLEREKDFTVVGVAENGIEAVKMVAEKRPDIVLMDINMPRMGGFEATRKIMENTPTPILLVSASWNIDDVKIILKSMDTGALGIFEKPRAPGHPEFKKLLDELITNIRIMSQVQVVRRWNHEKQAEVYKKPLPINICDRSYKAIVIGASTGGPPVLSAILKELPVDYPLPILAVQHMAKNFAKGFIEWLNGICLLNVKEAVDGEIIKSGNIYIGTDGRHMTIEQNRIKYIPPAKEDMFAPSVSKLFSSAATSYGKETLAILLSGMGRDGAMETTLLKDLGAVTIAQDEESSVVFGMAKEAIRLGGISSVLSLDGIKQTLLKLKNCKG